MDQREYSYEYFPDPNESNKLIKYQIDQEIIIQNDEHISLENPVFEDEKIKFTKPGLKRCINGDHKQDINNHKYLMARIDDEIRRNQTT